MNRKNINSKKIVVGLSMATVLAFVIAGCANDAADNQPTSTETPAATSTGGGSETGMTPAAYTNENGELICPVMGGTIESPEAAVGYMDHEGTRYYFCCDGCEPDFKKDPEKYIHAEDGGDHADH